MNLNYKQKINTWLLKKKKLGLLSQMYLSLAFLIIILILTYFRNDFYCEDFEKNILILRNSVEWQWFDTIYEYNYKYKDKLFINNRDYWLYIKWNKVEINYLKNYNIIINSISEEINPLTEKIGLKKEKLSLNEKNLIKLKRQIGKIKLFSKDRFEIKTFSFENELFFNIMFQNINLNSKDQQIEELRQAFVKLVISFKEIQEEKKQIFSEEKNKTILLLQELQNLKEENIKLKKINNKLRIESLENYKIN